MPNMDRRPTIHRKRDRLTTPSITPLRQLDRASTLALILADLQVTANHRRRSQLSLTRWRLYQTSKR
jgi:hypothetical protein